MIVNPSLYCSQAHKEASAREAELMGQLRETEQLRAGQKTRAEQAEQDATHKQQRIEELEAEIARLKAAGLKLTVPPLFLISAQVQPTP